MSETIFEPWTLKEFQELFEKKELDQYSFFIANDENNSPVFSSLTQTQHLLVVGKVGSGNDDFLHTFMCSMLLHNKPQNLQILLIDPSQIELSIYKDFPHIINNTCYTEENKILKALIFMKEELANRYSLFLQSSVTNITDYNNNTDKKNTTNPYCI